MSKSKRPRTAGGRARSAGLPESREPEKMQQEAEKVSQLIRQFFPWVADSMSPAMAFGCAETIPEAQSKDTGLTCECKATKKPRRTVARKSRLGFGGKRSDKI
jgi:hypothetical protein